MSPNLYIYVSNNPIIQKNETGYGLFKTIRGVFTYTRIKIQECKTAMTNAVKDFIGKIISVDYTRTTTKETYKRGNDNWISVSTGNSSSSTKTILGNKNSILKININNNDDNILKSTVSTSINVGNLSLSKDYGFSHGESYSLLLGDKKNRL